MTTKSQSTLSNLQREPRPRLSSLMVESFQELNTVKQCRICLENQEQSFPLPLIKPCKCAGSVSYVHQKCLHKWIQSTNNHNIASLKQKTIQCELCRYPITFEAEEKENCANCDQIVRKIKEKKSLFCMIIVLFIFSIAGTIISFYVIADQVRHLARGNGFYFIIILSVCGAVFSILFFTVSLFLLISEYLLRKFIKIGKVKEYVKKTRSNKVTPTHQPAENQSMQYISYVQ